MLVVRAAPVDRGFDAAEASIGSTRAWGRRLIGLCAERASLATANAWTSTLGGGFFLCRHIRSAQRMALRQLGLALRLGDPALASACDDVTDDVTDNASPTAGDPPLRREASVGAGVGE